MASILETGRLAPDFKLPASGGNAVSLAGFRGRILVLYFYPKDDTSGCTREAIDFSALLGEFSAAGAAVLGVSADSPASHAKFREKHKLRVDLASDETRTVLEAYGVWIEKSMYGRKYMGIDRATFLIDAKGLIRRIWRKVKVPGHAVEVLQAVQEA
jgi:peroxiredoxin Q/BCP